jgi:hypothetical protein
MILNVRVRPDCDPLVIAAQHRAEPDACTLQQSYVSDHNGVGRDPAIIGDLRLDAVQRVNRHRLSSALLRREKFIHRFRKNDTLKSGDLIRLFMGENGTGASCTAFAN